MRNLFQVLAISLVALLMGASIGAYAQNQMERPRVVRADICPAPELVRAHMVLDPRAPLQTYTGPQRAPLRNDRFGNANSASPEIVPVEPRTSQEVLDEFRQDYGLDIPAHEWLRTTTTPDGAIICHYRSNVVEPVVAIRTNSTTCSVAPGPWTGSGIQTCNQSRQACMFRCTGS